MARPVPDPEIVCAECVEDSALAALVRSEPADGPCDFCGSEQDTGWFEDVMARIKSALGKDWSIPEDELFADNESETGWAGAVLDGREVLAEIGYEPVREELHEAIVDALGDRQFCQKNYGFMRPTERRMAGWEQFKYVVKHQRRYTFWSMLADDDEYETLHPDFLAVGKMLDEVGALVRQSNVIRVVPKGTGFWRVRAHETGKSFSKGKDLSPPPLDKAVQANRMSPAGVAMFYGAEDWPTACAETVESTTDPLKSVSGGVFTTLRDLLLLDLIDLPEIPSYFDVERAELRHALTFLGQFAYDLAKPVSRDDRAHIEYVPTQAFTEYVRFQMRAENGQVFSGIRYRSCKNGKPCVVLFCGQPECVEDGGYGIERWLALDDDSVTTKPVSELKVPEPVPTNLFGEAAL